MILLHLRTVYVNLFSLTARRKLDEQFAQFDNVTTACQFYNAILDSLTLTNGFELRDICECHPIMFINVFAVFWRNEVELVDLLVGCLTARQHRKVNLCQLRGMKPAQVAKDGQ